MPAEAYPTMLWRRVLSSFKLVHNDNIQVYSGGSSFILIVLMTMQEMLLSYNISCMVLGIIEKR